MYKLDTWSDYASLLDRHLKPEKGFYFVIFFYMICVSVLSLAIPVAVQTLVNSIAYISLKQPLIIITSLLLFFSLFNVSLRMLKYFTAEMLQRRFVARKSLEITQNLWHQSQDEELYNSKGDYCRYERVNRAFEIFVGAKSIAKIYIGSLEIILQMFVGLSLLFFYHPYFIFYIFILIGGIFAILNIYLVPSLKTSLKESKTKYRLLSWMENFFHVAYPSLSKEKALERANELTQSYLDAKWSHFIKMISQLMLLLVLMALMSALLLGGGGLLVILEEMTLGQLVSAELVVTMIISNMNKAGSLLEQFYDTCAGLAKLDMYFPSDPNEVKSEF